ncbi:hypothetical protein L596_007927 [Steinernema carpocapsae]|uniref:Mannosyltransferase n=1 Tax=Steinernema carpocapsae TaxID=34508 RepID=A0A4V6A683_STECR|nr:hypothetical protein L596_007927 [Steinernema carpocapsae]
MSSIQNLNKPKDAFEQLEDEEGTRQGFCHIRIQQRTGRKTITTVQGVAPEYDLKKIVRYLKKVFALLLLYRILNVALVRTWFVPDEVFQSVEVAHKLAFGSGHLSWEWQHALRSVIHPSVIAALYWVLRFIGLESPATIVQAPRVLHAALFALGDLSFLKLARRLLKYRLAATFAVFAYLLCWFVFFCAPRTLSNSIETALILVALNWYPFEDARMPTRTWPYMSLGVLSILIRPTAVLVLAPLGIWHLLRSDRKVQLLFYECVPAMASIVAIGIVCDSLAFQKITFSTWNFAKFNVFDGGSAHFGVHPWHWYFSQGLASVMTVQLLPVCLGLFVHRSLRPCLSLFLISLWYTVFHSLLPHKEHRFLLPIIPFLCLHAGHFLAVSYRGSWRKSSPLFKFCVFLIIVVNVPLSLYTSLYHQVGPMAAARSVSSMLIPGSSSHLLQLLPCYSMPQYNHFHGQNVHIRSLDCSPNLLNDPNFVDEADLFHDDPNAFLLHSWSSFVNVSHIVIYEKIHELVRNFLDSRGFLVCDRLFHAHFPTSSRQDNYILVLCKS